MDRLKRVLGVSLIAALAVGLLLPGIPAMAGDPTGMAVTGAAARADERSAALAADVRHLAGLADEEGRVTAVIKLEAPPLLGVAQHEVIHQLKRHSERSQERVLRFLHANGATVLNTFWLTNAVLAEVPVALLDELGTFTEVERLIENFTVTVPEPEEEDENVGVLGTGYTWGLTKIRAPEVWDELGVTGSGVRVAVLDTGVDMTHPDLSGRMWTDDPADPTSPGGWAEFDGQGSIVTGSTPYDSGSHGTHCSGTVLGGDAGGTAIGVAPDAILMHGLVLHGGSGSLSQVIAGMQWAMAPFDQHGNPAGEPADVVSMSLGATGLYNAMIEPVQNMRAAGVVPVIAIGNSGEGSTGSPGNVYDAIGIGATDSNDNVAGFSSGAVINWPASHPEPYVKPDLSAPGVSVYSSVPGGGYSSWSGTSMATPHVAGAVALMLEADPASTVEKVYEILRETAIWHDRYYPEPPCTRYGWGRIDALEAVYLAAVDSGIEGVAIDTATGESVEGVRIDVHETGSGRYSDASGYYRFFLPPGTYTLSAGRFGYYEETAIIEVVEGAFTAQDFALQPVPTGTIEGTVTDTDTAEPVAGASVVLLDTPLGAHTNELGEYSIEAPAGTYNVRARAWGYKASVVPDVDVLEGETVIIDYALEPTLCVAVLGDYQSQLIGLLMDNDISAHARGWDIAADIGDYDAVVMNRPADPGQSTFAGFLDAAGDNGVGVVFTSSFPTGWAYGISLLHKYLGDPVGQDHKVFGGQVYYQVGKSHPIFDGWDVGEKITIITAGDRDHTWFWDYSGDTIADVGQENAGIRGEAVAVNEYGGSRHVLLASLAPTQWTNVPHWTEDAKTIFVRGVLYAGGVLDSGLRIVTGQLPAGTAGTDYQETLTATGGEEPYAWAVIDGALPAGLDLDAATGGISGTPTAAGTFAFTLQVTDDTGETAAADLSITIADSLEIITSELPDGQEGVPYQAALEAAGGVLPYAWAVIDGALPAGLGLDAATGAISGTPAAAGTFAFTVRVTDDTGETATASFSISIDVAELEIVTPELPAGQVASAYEAILEATGGTEPYTWAITDGALPTGLDLDAATGVISGTPAASDVFEFRVQVANPTGQTAAADLSITVVDSLEIITFELPDGQKGVPYQAALEAAGGFAPYTWAVIARAMPDGLVLSAAGAISGTPDTAAAFDFTVRVTDDAGETAAAEFSITIEPEPLEILTAGLPSGQVDTAYQATLEAAGGTMPYTWAVTDGALPAGLSLDTATGVISGTPTVVAIFDFTVRVTDDRGETATAELSITIHLHATADIVGQTWEVNCTVLPGATIEAFLEGVLHASTVSDDDGFYTLAVFEPGTYQVVAGKNGFRNETVSIHITELGEQYELDFRSDRGLIPAAPDVSYVLQCVNLWLYPPGEGCALSLFKVLAVINAWTYPV